MLRDLFSRRRAWFVLGGLAAVLLALGIVLDPDLSWHLATGKRIVETGTYPVRDVFSWTMLDQPWIDFEWATQAIFYLTLKAGGTAGLFALKAALLLASGAAFAGLLSVWEIPGPWACFGLVVFSAALFPLSTLRPELFTLLFFELELLALERRRLGLLRVSFPTLLAAHVLLYAAWANLHAGFVTGLLLCGCYAAGEAWGRGPRAARETAAFAAAGAAATLANPYGWQIYAVLFEHGRHMDMLRRLIIEWRSPSFSIGYLAGYWVAVVFSLGGLLVAVWQGDELAPEHLAAVAVLTVFASRAVRTTSYVVLLDLPLGLRAWTRVRAPSWWRPVFSAVAAAALAGFFVWRAVDVFVSEGAYARAVPLESLGPRGAADFLRREKAVLSGLTLFNPYNWGGYLDYQLFPDYRVFMDGRYLFAGTLDAVDEAQRNPDLWRDYLDEQGVELVLTQNDPIMLRLKGVDLTHPYTTFALPTKDWALVYWDSKALIYVRRDKAPAAWLARREFRWLRPHDLRQTGFYIVAGVATYAQVSAEIDRYGRDIGDDDVDFSLRLWRGDALRDLRKVEAAAAQARRRRGSAPQRERQKS